MAKKDDLLDVLSELSARLNRAEKALRSNAAKTEVYSERARLEHKADGVHLAITYVEEDIRLNY